MNTMDPILAGAPLLLDGGLGSELAARGHDLSSPLWSAGLVRDQPQAIVGVHRSYLEAGARCLISASYQASLPGLQAAGYDRAAAQAVITDSVGLARTAVADFLREHPACGYRPLVAASVGPYGAWLADGSEYRGNYGVNDDVLRHFHRERLRWLDTCGADLLACETIPDQQEARVLSELLRGVATPAWVSFCCADSQRLHDGSRLEDAVALFDAVPAVIAIGVNCVDPRHVDGLVRRLRALVGTRRVVVYPNAGAQYDAGRSCRNEQETVEQWARQALGWIAAGADIVGGCCRIGPAHIRQLARSDIWHC